MFIKRFLFFLSGLWITVVFIHAALRFDAVPASSFSPVCYTVVIDAGHGGEDGGAVSITGVPESQLNLSIALKLEDVLAFYGITPQMLRREDISLHNSDAATIREKKVSDLHNRVALIGEKENPLLISIHQNTFSQARYHGAQVFYADTPHSQEIAEKVQQNLCLHLDPSNLRQAKQIPETVYLMNHVTCPAILVECGFLSNPAEEALLRQDGYQKKLAASLAGTLLSLSDSITTR